MIKGVGILVLLVCLVGSVCALNVSLLSPADGYVFNSSVSSFNITFEYNVSGSSNVSYCNLSVNGSVDSSSNVSVLGNNSVSYLFDTNRMTHDSDESYNWSVVCEDLNGAVNSSSVWSFKVNISNASSVEEFLIVDDIGNYSFVNFDLGDIGEIMISGKFQNYTNGSMHFAYYENGVENRIMFVFRTKLHDDDSSFDDFLNDTFLNKTTRGNNSIYEMTSGGLCWVSGDYGVCLDKKSETSWVIVDAYLAKSFSVTVVTPVVPVTVPSGGGGSSSVVVEEASGWGAPINVSVNVSLNDSDSEEIIIEDVVEEEEDVSWFSSAVVGFSGVIGFVVLLGFLLVDHLVGIKGRK